jgi:hypothetical protein
MSDTPQEPVAEETPVDETPAEETPVGETHEFEVDDEMGTTST